MRRKWEGKMSLRDPIFAQFSAGALNFQSNRFSKGCGTEGEHGAGDRKGYRMKQAFGQDELHEREAVCTREDPPGCQAACPLRIDMRTVCVHLQKGSFSKAAAVIRTVTPFLFLLSKNCGGSCVKGCKLAESGDGVVLPALERACALYGGSGKINRFMLPRKSQRDRKSVV